MNEETIKVPRVWLETLYVKLQEYEEYPTDLKLVYLLGYLSLVETILKINNNT